MIAGIKAILLALSQDPGVVAALLIGVVILMYSHVHIWLSNRGRLKDKDAHIKDLIQERNRLQEYVLNQQGHNRMTSRRGRS